MTMHCAAGERLRRRDRSIAGRRPDFAAEATGPGRDGESDDGFSRHGAHRGANQNQSFESRSRARHGRGFQESKHDQDSGHGRLGQEAALRAAGTTRSAAGRQVSKREGERTSVTWPKLEKACWRMSVVVFHERFPARASGKLGGQRIVRERDRSHPARYKPEAAGRAVPDRASAGPRYAHGLSSWLATAPAEPSQARAGGPVAS